MTVVVMMQQYQKETTHVVLMNCVLVSDYGSLLQCQTCFPSVSDTNIVYDNTTIDFIAQVIEPTLDWTVALLFLHLI